MKIKRKELSCRQKAKILEQLFMDDEKFYNQFISGMTEEQFYKFLDECPEFIEDLKKISEEKKKKK